jgi:transposase
MTTSVLKGCFMQSATEKDLQNRIDEIRDELESLFKDNLKITDWNVPEADDQSAAEILISILERKLAEIKVDVQNKVYENY